MLLTYVSSKIRNHTLILYVNTSLKAFIISSYLFLFSTEMLFPLLLLFTVEEAELLILQLHIFFRLRNYSLFIAGRYREIDLIDLIVREELLSSVIFLI